MKELKKYWKCENSDEVRVVVALLGTAYDNSAWNIKTNYTYKYVFIDDEDVVGSFDNSYLDGYELSTIDDLVELARNGFKEPRWEPKIGEVYYSPLLTSEFKYVKQQANFPAYDKLACDANLAFKTKEEAIIMCDKMLSVAVEGVE